MSKDRRLGRGLAALLGTPLEEGMAGYSSDPMTITSTTAVGNASNLEAEPTGSPSSRQAMLRTLDREAKEQASVSRETPVDPRRVIDIQVDLVDNNPFQPRRQFNEQEIESLASSLKAHEQLQPILVRQVGERFQLISGERRLRAAIKAGFATIRGEVRDADDRMVAELAIVENLQRKDLNAVEKAYSFKRYLSEHKCTQDELAKRLKIDRSTIANLMRLLELPNKILDAIQADLISAGHARALLPLGDEKQQVEFAQQIQAEGWSVRDTERRVAECIAIEDGVEAPGSRVNQTEKRTKTDHLLSLEQEMKMALGTKVEIRQTGKGKGKIVISYSNELEFERIRRAFSETSGSQKQRNAA